MSGLDVALIAVYLTGIVGLGLWAWRRRRTETGLERPVLPGRRVAALADHRPGALLDQHLDHPPGQPGPGGLRQRPGLRQLRMDGRLPADRPGARSSPPSTSARGSPPCPTSWRSATVRASRDWLAVLSIISAIFIHIGFSLYTGRRRAARACSASTSYASIVVTALLTGLYTIVGGLLAVVVTESVQTVILHRRARPASLGFGLVRVGGWGGPRRRGRAGQADHPAHGGRDAEPALVRGLPGLPGHRPVVLVRRPDHRPARAGGQGRAQRPAGPAVRRVHQDPAGLHVRPARAHRLRSGPAGRPAGPGDSADTYSLLINHLLPVGLKGVVAAALLAALMSTVSGALNSIATLFSLRHLQALAAREPRSKRLTRIGRIVTFVAMVAAILWSPLISHFQSIFQGVTALICYIAPPITAVFVWGVFWKKASATARPRRRSRSARPWGWPFSSSTGSRTRPAGTCLR